MKSMILNSLILMCLLAACTGPRQAQPTETPPDAVVRAFYNEYLDYIGDPASGTFRNPLVDRVYRQSPYLSAEFIAQVDEELARAAAAGAGGADPFLQAQAIPEGITVELLTVEGERAQVRAHERFGTTGQQDLLITLVKNEQGWQIAAIEKAGR